MKKIIIDTIKKTIKNLLIEEKEKRLSEPKSMHYSVEQYIEFINKIYKFPKQASDFWTTVVKITWIMIASENDPMFIIHYIRNLEEEENNDRRTKI